MSEDDLAAVNLHTMLGVQQALAKLGLDPGTIDGFDGPHTRTAPCFTYPIRSTLEAG